MKELIMDCLIWGEVRAKHFSEKLLSDERGDTNFVSIMIIIAIVLVVAGIFRTQLMSIVNVVMERVMAFVSGGGE